jgi:outer membrane protein assembly factor BamA
VELVYPSPLNYAARTVFFAGVGKRDVEYRVSALTDKVFGLPFIYDLTFAYNMTRREVYDVEHKDVGSYREIRWGGRLQVGGQLPNWGLLTAGVRWEDHQNEYLSGKDRYLLGALETHLAIDTQDRSLFPNRGINLNSGYDAATSFLGSERYFNKLWGSFAGYATPLRRHTVCLRINGATCDRTTPFDERFKLGGMYSFPGLHLDQLNGATRIGGGCEYRFDLISRILADSYLGVRIDAAGIWSDPAAQIKADDWMHSGALYFALDTMFGPIIVMWGHLFTGGPLPEQDIIFIQVGNQF